MTQSGQSESGKALVREMPKHLKLALKMLANVRAAEPMRVLLHSTQTGRYFQTITGWTDSPVKAWDFERVERAQEAAREVGLDQVEVVLWYDQPPCELRLPIK